MAVPPSAPQATILVFLQPCGKTARLAHALRVRGRARVPSRILWSVGERLRVSPEVSLLVLAFKALRAALVLDAYRPPAAVLNAARGGGLSQAIPPVSSPGVRHHECAHFPCCRFIGGFLVHRVFAATHDETP